MTERDALEAYAQEHNTLHRSVKEQYIDKFFGHMPGNFTRHQ